MFCPLCTSEFRDGFSTCSDCHMALVSSLQEAESGRMRFWKGDRQEKLDSILKALDSEEVPAYFKEILNAHPNFRLRILGIVIPLGRQEPIFEYEVWILKRDLARSRRAVSSLQNSFSEHLQQ